MSCPDCFRGFIHDYAEPTGTEQVLYGVRTYIAGRSEQRVSASTIIFMTDVFGFNLVNNKLLADYFVATTGFNVLIPDLVPGGGVPLSALTTMETFTLPVRWWDIRGQVVRALCLVRMLGFFLPVFFKTNAVFPTVLAYARAVKAGLPVGAKLGVAGYCWGGLQTTKLSKEPAVKGGREALVNAHYTAHPSSLKLPKDIIESMGMFHVPFSMAIGDRDFAVSRDDVAQLEAVMRQEFGDGNGDYQYEIKLYPECAHGFALRANRNKTFEDVAANEAAAQAVEWFRKFLAKS